MTIKQTAVQKLTRPNSIWTSFTLILACIMLGLISLSGHALRLSHASAESQQREKMQQEIALALWRLDSGLPNYIATLTDPPKSQPNENSYRLNQEKIQYPGIERRNKSKTSLSSFCHGTRE